tara:strand:- start:2407 stop:2814 length:408 start_codon:yes stop_codon:yes gene_type:complete
MNKNELKKVLKPLIKECIKECIFDEGVLSGIITEVVAGLETRRVVTEGVTITKADDRSEEIRKKEEEYERQRQERIKRLNETMSDKVGISIFEGTAPSAPETSGHGSLAGTDPGDAGVNIEGILGLVGNKWKSLT